VPPAAPAAALLFEDAPGGLGESGDALGAALLREGVAAGAGQLAVGEGQLAGLGERDEPGGAEAEFAASAADDEPLDPTSLAGGLDEQVQAVAVGVASGRCGTDEGGRERLRRDGGLGAWFCGTERRFRLQQPFPHYMREWAGFRNTS